MKRVFIGQERLISYGGRLFKDCMVAADAAMVAEWAVGVLAAPDVIYPNGKHSHEVAGMELERAEDTLLDFMRIVC